MFEEPVLQNFGNHPGGHGMLKIVSVTITFLFSTAVFAADPPIYQVVLKVQKAGKDVGSSSVTVMEGQKGDVRSVLEDSTGTYFDVTVTSGSKDKLSMDYHFKDKTDKQSIEIGKTKVALVSGGTEKSELKDSSGNDISLQITVSKQAAPPKGAEKALQKFRLRDGEAH